MNTLLNVARYHVVDRLTYIALPWAILAFSFAVNLVVFAVVPPAPDGNYYSGGLATIYVFLLVAGALSMTRSLPFGLALGLSRRTYYLGTALLVAGLAAVYGLALTLLTVVERLSGGWGLGVHFFRVPWILDGPWYLTWLTSFVLLALLFGYGMWHGLIYQRGNVPGLVAFIAAQVLVVLAAVVAVSLTGSWPAVGQFFAGITAPGITGVLAAVVLVMGIGGYSTVRRATV